MQRRVGEKNTREPLRFSRFEREQGTGREVVAEFGAQAQFAGLDRGAGKGEGPHGFQGRWAGCRCTCS